MCSGQEEWRRDMSRDVLDKKNQNRRVAMFVKLGNACINLCVVPIIEFDVDDENRERVIFWLHQGPVAYVKGTEVPEEEFDNFKTQLEILRKGVLYVSNFKA